MNCPICKSPNAEARNYCGACGGHMVKYCGICGFRNQAADNFCGGCGALGSSPRVERPAEKVDIPARSASPDPAPGIAPDSPALALAELVDLAREAAQAPEELPDAKVTQDDIDSLFGD